MRYELQRDVGRITAPAVAVVKLIQAGEDRPVVRQSGFIVLYADEGMEATSPGAPTGAGYSLYPSCPDISIYSSHTSCTLDSSRSLRPYCDYWRVYV